LTNVSLVDAAMPGMLPVINEFCVAQAVRTGLGLKARSTYSAFDRKNYFYPDLPQGYQISQFKHPIVGEGEEVLVDGRDGTGHESASSGCTWSRTRASRSTTAPDHVLRRPQPLRRRADGDRLQARHPLGPEEAAAYVSKLLIMRYLGTCDGNMEKGNLRADVNVSICAL
jgi:aspartyl-tRNA(Asn)/glutamyl-tRNA(Gln) amidotransferase subunit B